MSTLVVDETGNSSRRQRLGGVPIAAAMFRDAVHDNEPGPSALGYHLIARELRHHVPVSGTVRGDFCENPTASAGSRPCLWAAGMSMAGNKAFTAAILRCRARFGFFSSFA